MVDLLITFYIGKSVRTYCALRGCVAGKRPIICQWRYRSPPFTFVEEVRDTGIEEYARARSENATRVTTVHIGVVEVLRKHKQDTD